MIREQFSLLNNFLGCLISDKSYTRGNWPPCVDSSGISDGVYHAFDLPKRVSPGVKAATAAPRAVLSKLLKDSLSTFVHPGVLLVMDVCFLCFATGSAFPCCHKQGAKGNGFSACGCLEKASKWQVRKTNPVAIGCKAAMYSASPA